MSDTVEKIDIDQGVGDALELRADLNTAISVLSEQRRYSLRVKPAQREAVTSAAGIELPQRIGETVRSDDRRRIHCLGPDEWLIVAYNDVDIAGKFSSAPAPFSLVDVSHRNVAIDIKGENAAALINIGCPLDLALSVFPAGKATRTIFERAEIMLYRVGENHFIVETWRSFAPYFLNILKKA